MKRLLGACALEIRVAWRYGIIAIAAVLAVLWTALLSAMPSAAAEGGGRYLLFLDTAGFGALFAVALLMFERIEGTDTARAITPLKAGETTAVRIGLLTALAVAIAIPMTVAIVPLARLGAALGYTAAGVALTSVVLLATCLGLGARTRTIQGAMLATVPACGPLVAIPVLHLSEVVQSPLLWIVPTTVGADLISRGVTGQAAIADGALMAAVVYGVGCAVAACWWAARGAGSGRADTPPHRAPVAAMATDGVGAGHVETPAGRAETPARGAEAPAGGTEVPAGRAEVSAGRAHRPVALRTRHEDAHASIDPTPARHPVVSLARHEFTGVLRDPLLLTVALAPVLLALGVRWLYPAISEFLRSTHGFDLAPHAPAVFGTLVLLHVPVMVGSVVALRVVEDIDDRTILVLRVSPLSLTAYFALRVATAALLTLTGLAVLGPLSGLSPPVSPGLIGAVVLAAAMAPLVVMVTAAFASNKVEAFVVIKGVGALSVLLPVLAWVLPTPWWAPLLVLAPTWPLLALAGYPGDAVPLPVILLAGLAIATATAAVLAWRVRSRLLM